MAKQKKKQAKPEQAEKSPATEAAAKVEAPETVKQAKPEQAKAKGFTVKNGCAKTSVLVDGVKLSPGAELTLTKAQLDNGALMAKVNHGIKTNLLVKV